MTGYRYVGKECHGASVGPTAAHSILSQVVSADLRDPSWRGVRRRACGSRLPTAIAAICVFPRFVGARVSGFSALCPGRQTCRHPHMHTQQNAAAACWVACRSDLPP